MVLGEWVKAYRQGIWQIHRILHTPSEMRYSLSSPRVTSSGITVFVRRFVDAKWRPAFTTECCDQSFVKPLSSEERTQLDDLLQDQRLRESFERYAPEPVDLIVNLRFGLSDRQRLDAFCAHTLSASIASGMVMDDVLQMLEAAGLARFVSQNPTTATLQMVCLDHEMRDGEFVLRTCRVLDF